MTVSVVDPLGDPVSGARAALGDLRGESGPLGEIRFDPSAVASTSLEVNCPPGYRGAPLQRRISSLLLGAGVPLSFRHQCVLEAPDFALAVHVAGCGEVTLELDGTPVGTTTAGYREVLLPLPEETFVELVARPLEEDCRLEEPVRQVVIDPVAPAAWVQFNGTRESKRTVGARSVRRRSPAVPQRL